MCNKMEIFESHTWSYVVTLQKGNLVIRKGDKYEIIMTSPSNNVLILYTTYRLQADIDFMTQRSSYS